MATKEHSWFCVLQLAKAESVMRLQCTFHCDTPSGDNVCTCSFSVKTLAVFANVIIRDDQENVLSKGESFT